MTTRLTISYLDSPDNSKGYDCAERWLQKKTLKVKIELKYAQTAKLSEVRYNIMGCPQCQRRLLRCRR